MTKEERETLLKQLCDVCKLLMLLNATHKNLDIHKSLNKSRPYTPHNEAYITFSYS